MCVCVYIYIYRMWKIYICICWCFYRTVRIDSSSKVKKHILNHLTEKYVMLLVEDYGQNNFILFIIFI